MEPTSKTETPDATVVRDNELGMQTKSNTETLAKFEPMQESQRTKLEDFDRLCCLGDELACQRLGSKHHRTNSRCWNYPKTCYHCDLVASVDSKAKLLYMTSVQVQLGMLNTSSLHVNAGSLSKKVKSVNGKSFNKNRRTRARIAHKAEDMSEPETSGSVEMICNVESNSGFKIRDITSDITSPDSDIGRSPNTLARSIEGYVPFKMDPSDLEMRGGLYGKDLDGEQYRRSQAPSPELQTGSGFCEGDGASISREPLSVERDPRYELRFLMT